MDNEKNGENIVLCGANSYDQKYYMNERFERLPDSVQDQLKIICVSFVEDVGGILTLEFEPDGTLVLKTIAEDADYLYDEIGAGLKINRLQRTQTELFEKLETYYRIVCLKEQIPEEVLKAMADQEAADREAAAQEKADQEAADREADEQEEDS